MKVVATLPTYNEAGNVERVVRGLRALKGAEGLPPEVLVADDDSPDGTAEVVRTLAASDPGVRLLLRVREKGRGRAGRDAFVAALEAGADVVVEMDADGSHPPEDVPRLLAALAAGADVALGSRRVEGGGEEGRGVHRRILTAAAARLARRLIGTRVADPTTGFRAYTRAALEAIEPATLDSVGPEIVEEVLYRAERAGLAIVEVPFVFRKRGAGSSKLNARRIARVLAATVRLSLRGRV